jgi:hypothetical protein
MNEKDDEIAHPGMVSKPEKTPNFGGGFLGRRNTSSKYTCRIIARVG